VEGISVLTMEGISSIVPSCSTCAGISFKSQALYVAVFVTRYPDLFFTYISLYNSIMKIFFIASSIYICYMMLVPLKATHDKEKVHHLSFLWPPTQQMTWFSPTFVLFRMRSNWSTCFRQWSFWPSLPPTSTLLLRLEPLSFPLFACCLP